MKNYLIIGFILLSSCQPKNTGVMDNKNNLNVQQKLSGEKIEVREFGNVFKYENDTIKQTVEFILLKKDCIKFKLTSKNKMKNESSHLEGIAKLKGGDVELDEDSDGNAYPVDEYVYNNGCWVSFRIDTDTKSKMSIKEGNCTEKHSLICPFMSVGILELTTSNVPKVTSSK